MSTLLSKIHHLIEPTDALNPKDEAVKPIPGFDRVLQQHLVGLKRLFYAGRQFDYAAFMGSSEMQQLQTDLSQLHHFDPSQLPTMERQRSFWINLYNILILHGIIALDIRQSIRQAPRFFDRAAYVVNGCRLSANAIEHGILRDNSGHPALPFRVFRKRDPRQNFVLPLDPRIHFALNCAARSCPPISAYDGEKLDNQLELATRAFINGGGVELDIAAFEMYISPIFNWYRKDFLSKFPDLSSHDALVQFIAPYVDDAAARQALCESPQLFRVRYQKYDWRINQMQPYQA